MSATGKSILRQQALAARQGQEHHQAALSRRLIEALKPHSGAILAGYWPIRGEADPIAVLQNHTGPVCLPVVLGKGRALAFRLWSGGALVVGPYGTSHPAPTAPLIVPDVLIVPLAGFDRAGNRIGYGAGFYDRTLTELREKRDICAIGLAFAVQETAAIPVEPFDQRLDQIVTEREIIFCAAN